MHRRLAVALLALLCNSILAFPIVAQEPATTGTATAFPALPQQQQVSFDYNGKLMRLTWEFEKQFAILRSYPYLHEARLFQTGDTAFTLEATHIVDGKVERERKPLTMQEVSRIRYETSDALHSFAMWGNEERTAVWEDWALGAGTFGWSLAAGLVTDVAYSLQRTNGQQIQSSQPIWWIPTLTVTGAYTWAVNQSWYNRASATMWGNGLLQGTSHGLAIYLLIASQTSNPADLILAGTIFGAVEAGAGLALAHVFNFSTAQAQMITAFGSSGLYVGLLSQFVSGNNFLSIPSNNIARAFGATALIGSAAGMWIGNEVAKSPAITGGDAVVMTTPASIIGSSPLYIFSASPTATSIQVVSGVTIGAIVGGHFLGGALVREKDFSFLQGRIINLVTGIGSVLPTYAFAGAVSRAGFNGQVSQAQSLQLTSAIASLVGGIVGFTIPYLIYSKEAEEQHQRRLTATGAQAFAPRAIPHEVTWWENLAANTDVQFSPLGLLPLLSPASASGLGLGAVGMGLPIMSIRTVLGSPAPKPIPDNEINEQR